MAASQRADDKVHRVGKDAARLCDKYGGSLYGVLVWGSVCHTEPWELESKQIYVPVSVIMAGRVVYGDQRFY